MTTPTHTQQSYPNAVLPLEKISRLIRWLVLGVTIVTFPYNSANLHYMILFGTIVASYNLARHEPYVHSLPLLANAYFIAFVDYALISWLLYMSGGLHSPFLILLTFPVFGAILLRPATQYYSVILTLLASGGIALSMVLRRSEIVTYSEIIFDTIVCLLLLIVLLFIELLTKEERLRRDKALAQQHTAIAERERVTTLVNSIAEGVIAVNSSGIITQFNPAAQKLLDTNKLHRMNIHTILHLEDSQGSRFATQKLFKDAQQIIRRNDLAQVNRDGSKTNLELSIAPITQKNIKTSKDSAFIMVLSDITKAKNIEQERQDFLSMIAHELRTPITAASSSIAVILDPNIMKLEKDAEEFVKMAQENIHYLGGLISDISTLAQLDRGTINVEPEVLKADELLHKIIKEHINAAVGKNLKLTVNVKRDTPAIITSHQEIKEILHNLIANAIKYTQKGSVTVGAKPSSGTESGVVFFVKDTGIGISANDKVHLFEKFYRSDDNRATSEAGTGLGLYICQRLTERLNGRLWLESTVNKGSTFYLYVPPSSDRKEDRKKVMRAKLDSMINSF